MGCRVEQLPSGQFKKKINRELNMLRNIIIAVIAAFVVAWLITRPPSPEQATKNNRRNAIGLCWSEYDKKSLAPDVKRFVAKSCEDMEALYVKDYGSRP